MKVFLFIFLFLFCEYSFTFISDYLNISKDSLEYRILTNPQNYDLLTIFSTASEIDYNNFLLFSNRIENIIKLLTNTDKEKRAEELFKKMHNEFLKRYDINSSDIKTILRNGYYNCISSTSLYSILLEKAGYNFISIVTPTHIYTRLLFDNKEIDVENTTPDGFDIKSKKNVQTKFKENTGFEYITDKERIVIANKSKLVAYYYANLSAQADIEKKFDISFQYAIKAAMIDHEGKYTISNNIVSSYNNYPVYLIKYKKDYIKAFNIIGEGVKYYNINLFKNNFNFCVDYLSEFYIDNSRYDDLYQLINTNKDYIEKSVIYNIFVKVSDICTKEFDNLKALNFLTNNFIFLNDERNKYDILNYYLNNSVINFTKQNIPLKKLLDYYASLKEFFIANNMKSEFDNYYSMIYTEKAINLFNSKDYQGALNLIKDGLKELQLNKNINDTYKYIIVNYSVLLVNSKDYSKAISILTEGYNLYKDEKIIRDNLKETYKIFAYDEYRKSKKDSALKILEEAINIFGKEKDIMDMYNSLKGR